jgi:hypothetical protein
VFIPEHKLTDAEKEKILAIANADEFKDRTPHQIVPILAERGQYIASESSFYSVLVYPWQVYQFAKYLNKTEPY